MKLLSLETKTTHHEYDDLDITLEYNERYMNGPTMAIKHAGVRDAITLTLDEIDNLKAIADKFRSMVVKIGE